jgi:hypothetical protein
MYVNILPLNMSTVTGIITTGLCINIMQSNHQITVSEVEFMI